MPTSSQFAHCRGASQKHKNSGGGERERKREGKKREGKILFQLNSKKEKKIEGGGAKYFTKQFKVVTKINVFYKKENKTNATKQMHRKLVARNAGEKKKIIVNTNLKLHIHKQGENRTALNSIGTR